MQQNFEIKNVNGIEDLRVCLDGPGVYVARGPNGAGKSSAIEAMRAASGDKDARAEVTDGINKGSVEVKGGGGEEVILGVGSRRRLDGFPSVRLVSTGALGTLIDPGLQDGKLAARARVKALLQLMPLPADDAARFELTANDEELQNYIRRDPATDAADLSEAVRKRANELACDLEKDSAAASGEEQSLNGLIIELGTIDFEAGDLKEARAEADRMLREAERKVLKSEERKKLEAQQAEVRSVQGPRPNVQDAAARVDALAKDIAELDSRLAVIKEQHHHAKTERIRLEDAVRLWDSQSQILQRVPEGPSMAEANEFTKLAEAAAGKALRAERLDQAKGYLEKANAAKERAVRTADRAKALRSIAQGTADALGRLLERRGLPGLVIVEGRLGVKTGKGADGNGGKGEEVIKDFDARLSFGERVRTALGIALAGMHDDNGGGRNGVSDDSPEGDSLSGNRYGGDQRLPILPLEPEFWNALDKKNKLELCEIARERGVCLVTEEPCDGPLRVERMGP